MTQWVPGLGFSSSRRKETDYDGSEAKGELPEGKPHTVTLQLPCAAVALLRQSLRAYTILPSISLGPVSPAPYRTGCCPTSKTFFEFLDPRLDSSSSCFLSTLLSILLAFEVRFFFLVLHLSHH